MSCTGGGGGGGGGGVRRYETCFRSVHRACALLLPFLLFFHSVMQQLGQWLIWTWMLLIIMFALAE